MVRVSGFKYNIFIRRYSRQLCDHKQQGISEILTKTLQDKPNITHKQTIELQAIKELFL